MKPFQQLLLAMAGTGLMAPMAASAQDLASMNGTAAINGYMQQQEIDELKAWRSQNQVTSVNQFSDVKPTDWAYQALSNLVEKYGCVAGYPNGSYKGGSAMTRYEAAALLNACLDRVTEVTEELKRLMSEFEKELAVIKGRVDGLEAKVGELEANQFSTTTKLKGQATFTIGGVNDAPYAFAAPVYADATRKGPGISNWPNVNKPFSPAYAQEDSSFKFKATDKVFEEEKSNEVKLTSKFEGGKTYVNNKGAFFVSNGEDYAYIPASQSGNEITFNYDVRLNFDTSFTGKDLLRTQLRSGNSFNSAFGSGASLLEVFADQCDGINSPNGCTDGVNINRLFYQFPIGSSFTATVGAKVRQDDMLPIWPSAYPADSILDFFTYAGAPGAYSLNLGAGAGLSWSSNGWSLAAVYVSDSLDAPDSSSGLFEGYTVTGQLGYAKDNWGLAVAYTYGSNADGGSGQLLGNGTSIANYLASFPGATTSSIGVSAYWTPSESGWVPSISAGFGYTALDDSLFGSDYDMWSWSVGLQWSDVFVKGNNFGVAVGMPTFVNDDCFTSPTMLEVWYKFQVTDNISVTPAIFWIQDGAYGVDVLGANPQDTIGAVLKTTFKF